MILTCPDCATSYFVDDARIPAAGRTVKCTSCGARWQAKRDEASFSTIPDEAAAAPAPEPEAPQAVVDAPVAPAPPETDIPFAPIIASVPKTKPAGKARGRAIVVAAVAAVLVGMAAAAMLLRDTVAAVLPSTGGAYAALGLPVAAHGLMIEGVKAEPIFVGGRPALSVTGAIRNAGHEPLEAAPLAIHLLNAAGKTVAQKTATPEEGQVPGGATRYFAVAFVDPPKGAHDLEVVFVDKAVKHGDSAPKVRAHDAAPAVATHAEPEEAKALPAGSPDALEHYE